ncbi:hypothetical protein ANTPLA_LOCUS8009 [Anthophora plagiata]
MLIGTGPALASLSIGQHSLSPRNGPDLATPSGVMDHDGSPTTSRIGQSPYSPLRQKSQKSVLTPVSRPQRYTVKKS